MALHPQTSKRLPDGVVRLGREAAFGYQRGLLERHNPQTEVAALRYGGLLLGMVGSTSGFWMLHFFRKQMALQLEGRITTYLPTVVLPALLGNFLHTQFITGPILLQEPHCPLCLSLRASALQMGVGFIYPLVLSPIASIMAATRHKLYYIPKEPKAVLKVVVDAARPNLNAIIALAVAQFVFSNAVTFREYFEFEQFQKRLFIQEELRREEEFSDNICD